MGEQGRRIQLKIELDLWDWSIGRIKETLDITNDALNYRFQKTIKTPKGSCQLAILPQSADTHILDIVNPMDVIRISEFGNLKFVGYIQRISYTGSIDKEGKPHREATLTAVQFGGLLVDASTGFGLGTALGKEDGDLITYSTQLFKSIADAVLDGVTYSEMITVLIENFRDYLTNLGGKNFLTYLEQYLDVETGLKSTRSALLPRTFDFYTGTEQTLTFWQVAEQLVEKPFNEFWIDNGPRKVCIDGKLIELSAKSCLVFRETPFDGTVGGTSEQVFRDIKDIYIDKDHLLRFDLARSMDEVYTVYNVKEAAYQLNDIARIFTGQWKIDYGRIGKYLFKPLITELFYVRTEDEDGKSLIPEGEMLTVGQNAADTLKAWFENNDEYLSGSLSMMVPSDGALDPKIGDKISVYGIEGFFYVEGIAHTWTYQGPLKSDLTVTRGYNKTKRIELKDRIFRRNRIQ